MYTSLQGQQKIDILKKIKQQSSIIDFGLARGFELAGERFDLTTVVKEEKANDCLIRAGQANKCHSLPRMMGGGGGECLSIIPSG